MDVETGVPCDKNVPEKSKCLRVFITLFHLVICLYYIALSAFGGILFLNTYAHENELIRFMARFGPAFGTNWNLVFQTVFLFLALTHDMLEWMNKHESTRAKKIAYWRDIIFNALVFPYTLFVSIMFWSLYAIDRELVFPKVFDTIVPWWFNHCVHTNICIIILVETILTARRHPINKSLEIKINLSVAFGYAVVYYSIYFITNRWLYNVFGVMTWWQVCLYQLLIWTSSYVFYFIHFPINRLFHGEPEKDPVDQPQTEEIPKDNGTLKNGEIGSLQKSSDFETLAAENWNLKYRSLRDKFENSRL